MENLWFNYKRNILPIPTVYVPRVVDRRIKLQKHTTYIVSQVDVGELSLPFCVAKHEMKGMGRFIYCHRMNQNALLIGNKPD